MIETILTVGSMIVDGANIAQFCRTLLGGNALKNEIDALIKAQQDQSAQLQKINDQLIYVANRDGLTNESSNSSEQITISDTKKTGLPLDKIVDAAQEIINTTHNSDENKEARLLGSAPIKVPENFLSTIVDKGKKHDMETFLDTRPKYDNDDANSVMVVFSDGDDTFVSFTTQEAISKAGFKLNRPWKPNGEDLPSGTKQPVEGEWQLWGSESGIKEYEQQKEMQQNKVSIIKQPENDTLLNGASPPNDEIVENTEVDVMVQDIINRMQKKIQKDIEIEKEKHRREERQKQIVAAIGIAVIGLIIGASIEAIGIAFGIKIENTATGAVFWANSIGGLWALVGLFFGFGVAINALITGTIIGAIGGAIGGRIIWSIGVWLNSIIFWAIFWAIFFVIMVGIKLKIDQTISQRGRLR